MGPILARIASSPAADAIVRIADADDRDLVALYGAATAFAFPSLDEGFGLPPLEAMGCGAACVLADVPPLREVGGAAADYVPATDADALAAALERLWREAGARAALGAAGRAQAARFSSGAWIERMFAIYRALLAEGPRGARARPSIAPITQK